ncbi:MAG: hypothetical protein R3349_01215, partial [Geminicoccaceae bacterium]|nr:hypothetical protein [Geminicoccaceae bacterium]
PFRLDEEGMPVPSLDGGRRVLLDRVERLEFGYFGVADGDAEPAWMEVWQEQDLLPTLIRVRVAHAEGERQSFPELIVRPMIDFVGVF